MRILLLAALLAAGPALGDSEYRKGSDWVRLTALPYASEPVAALITAGGEDPTDYRAATAEFEGHRFVGCWRPMFEREMIYLRYEDGDAGLVPFGALKPIKEV